jgi:hypothetical protein
MKKINPWGNPMGVTRFMTVAGVVLLAAGPVSAGIVNNQGNIYNFNATTDIYSLVYGGPTIGSHGGATFADNAPFSFNVSRQGATLAAGDTISAGEQLVALQGGLTFDVHALNLTVTADQATLGSTPLKDVLGTPLDGSVVHGLKGTLDYTILSGSHAIYSGTFVLRAEDSTLTMGIATERNGFFSIFLCGGSGGPFQTEPDASDAVLNVLDPDFDAQSGVDAATNGLGIELAFGTADPAELPEPAMLALFGVPAGVILAGRRRSGASPQAATTL